LVGVIVSESRGASGFVRSALGAGIPVLLTSVPAERGEWNELSQSHSEQLSLSRPLQFDPLIARAVEIAREGTIGIPRTLAIGWSFEPEAGITTGASELIDAACVLLDSAPKSIYAVACEVAGPPLMKINVLTTNGSHAAIDISASDSGFPPLRNLHLLATEGEIVHRIGHDNLLLRSGKTATSTHFSEVATLRSSELAAWIDGERSVRTARGERLIWNVSAMEAVAQSLATGETVAVAKGVTNHDG
jgi:hypothetical protein